MTKILHLEHPEDSVLNGNLSVINWFLTPGHLSTKIDGAPSLVYGVNPENDKFFVGTKSVWNKRIPKICYSEEDIFNFYSTETHSELIRILCACLKYLPRTDGIFQADFIGFGGSSEYTPNTITYQFSEIVTQNIIIAPHTFYETSTTLQDAIAHPDCSTWKNTEHVKYVKPDAYVLHAHPWSKGNNPVCFDDVEEVCRFALQMAQTVTFVNGKELIELKKQLNACIRKEKEVEPKDFDCDSNLISFWKLIRSITEDCLHLCRNHGPAAYIGSDRVDAEGYVFTNEFGTYKLINRACFSYHNFNNGRFQKCHSTPPTATGTPL